MSTMEINQLESVLNLHTNETITSIKTDRLTPLGYNYGSLMLSLNITIEDTNTTKELSLVAKLIPPNDYLQQVFMIQQSFRNEINFYKEIIPTLQSFQKEQGVVNVIQCFPKFYGGRTSLLDDNQVDADAVIILENLISKNYTNVEKTKGYDLEAANLIVRDLASFHAVGMGLKVLHPERFQQKIAPHLMASTSNEKYVSSNGRRNIQVAESIPELVDYLDRIRKAYDPKLYEYKSRELFSAIVHNDTWVNNTMIKVENGKVVDNKLIDFQFCEDTSVVRDLIFFIFTSVESEVVLENYDDLIRVYYNTFIDNLKQVKCSTERFTFEAFLDEIDYEAKHSQFFNITHMLPRPIFEESKDMVELSELTRGHFQNINYSELYKKKLTFVIKEFAKNNWI